MLPWMLSSGFPGLHTRHLRFHLARAVVGVFAMGLWFTSLALVPLADAVALNFTLPLVEPVRPDEAGLTLQVYDPTYYVEILYAEGWEPVFDASPAAGCSAEVQPPDPDPQMVALAYALDASQTGGDGLGVHFAETLRVRCP